MVWRRPSRRFRSGSARRRSIAVACTAVLGGTVVLPGPATAQPRPGIGTVEQRLDALEHEAEYAAERLNAATDAAAEVDRRLAKVNAKVVASERTLADVRQIVGRLSADTYRSGTLDPTLELLLSDRPENFLAQASALRHLGERQSTALRRAGHRAQPPRPGHARCRPAAREAHRGAAQVAAGEGDHRDQGRGVAHAPRVAAGAGARPARGRPGRGRPSLRGRSARRPQRGPCRHAVRSRPVHDSLRRRPGRAHGASFRRLVRPARVAIGTALSQVGDRYVYGADGPSAFDCSGLTTFAYRAAGVSLPRSSGAQYAAGRKVSRSELAPGDLVYFSPPISHVGIYLSDGRIVHASNPRTGVLVSAMNDRNVVGATRP